MTGKTIDTFPQNVRNIAAQVTYYYYIYTKMTGKSRHIPSECTEYCCPGNVLLLCIYTKITGKTISNLIIGF